MYKTFEFRIALRDAPYPIWRTVFIPAETTFQRLHETIQYAMGWENVHLYQFEFSRQLYKIGIVETEDEVAEHESWMNAINHFDKERNLVIERVPKSLRVGKKTRLIGLVNRFIQFTYTYDYGDHWVHDVTFVGEVNEYPYPYPLVFEGEGACPPEDVGGINGFKDFLEAYYDPEHPEHERMREWGANRFVPFYKEGTNRLLARHVQVKRVKKRKGGR